jgi:hypothetical protein
MSPDGLRNPPWHLRNVRNLRNVPWQFLCFVYHRLASALQFNQVGRGIIIIIIIIIIVVVIVIVAII